MKKIDTKTLIILCAVVVLVILGVGAFLVLKPKEENVNPSTDTSNPSENEEKRSLVVYFSATGGTKRIAELIGESLQTEVVEILPSEAYTDEDLAYSNEESRAFQEQNDDSARPKIKDKIDIKDYDVIYLGYPIWFDEAPKIIYTFLDSANFEGKEVVLFCTSDTSGIDQSERTLIKAYPDIQFIQGRRFPKNAGLAPIRSWVKGLHV